MLEVCRVPIAIVSLFYNTIHRCQPGYLLVQGLSCNAGASTPTHLDQDIFSVAGVFGVAGEALEGVAGWDQHAEEDQGAQHPGQHRGPQHPG